MASVCLAGQEPPDLALLDGIDDPGVPAHECGVPADICGLALNTCYQEGRLGRPDSRVELATCSSPEEGRSSPGPSPGRARPLRGLLPSG